jgi:hypothetical protein
MLKLDRPGRAALTLGLVVIAAVITWAMSRDVAVWLRAVATLGATAVCGLVAYGAKMLSLPPILADEAAAREAALKEELATHEVAEPDHPIEEALGYILIGEWTKQFPADLTLVPKALDRMRHLAFKGRIAIWGRVSPTSLPKAVPAHIWEHRGVDLQRFWDPSIETVETEKLFDEKSNAYRFRDLQVIRAQIEREWPRTA